MIRENRLLFFLIIVSGFLGFCALIIDQIAIQQESSVRSHQIQTQQTQVESIFLKNFSSSTLKIEMSANNFYESVQSRFLVISSPKLFDLNQNDCPDSENYKDWGCFHDSLENLKKDYFRFHAFATDLVEEEYDAMIMYSGEIKGSREILNKFLERMEEFKIKIDISEDQKAIYNDDETYLSALNYLSSLRMLIDQESTKRDIESIEMLDLTSKLMAYKQTLLLVAIFFQICSLIVILYFFKKFLLLFPDT